MSAIKQVSCQLSVQVKKEIFAQYMGIWFHIPLKSKRLVAAAGRQEGTLQLRKPGYKYANDKMATFPFYLENCYLFRYLSVPAISDLSSKNH